jgi:hypothetical protein
VGRVSQFIANDHAGSRKDTAVLLVGTAREFGINQRDIRTTTSGFYISDALATVLYDESQQDAVSGNETKPAKKTSGNRAAKNKPTEKE